MGDFLLAWARNLLAVLLVLAVAFSAFLLVIWLFPTGTEGGKQLAGIVGLLTAVGVVLSGIMAATEPRL